MDGKLIILFFVFFFVTSFLELMYTLFVRKKNEYSLSEYTANVALGITSTLVGVLIKAVSFGAYLFIYENWRLFTPEMSVVYMVYAFLAYDFVYYWVHRVNHEVNILWAGHSIHHSGEDFNFSTAVRIGIVSALMTWPLFLPLAFFGVSLEVYLTLYSIQVMYQYALHTKCIPKLGILEKVLYTPSQHRVHHCKNRQYIDKNHGAFLCIWDRLFGTFQEELDDVEQKYGTTNKINSFVPEIINFKEIYVQFKLALKAGDMKAGLKVLFGKPFTWPKSEKPAPLQPLVFNLKAHGYMLLSFVAALLITADLLLAYNDIDKTQTGVYLGLIFVLLNVVGAQFSKLNMPVLLGANVVGIAGVFYFQLSQVGSPLLSGISGALLVISSLYAVLTHTKIKPQVS